MMRTADEGQGVDVRQAARGPFIDMVDFGQVARNVTSRRGAPTVLVVQNYSLVSGGNPLGATEVDGTLGMLSKTHR